MAAHAGFAYDDTIHWSAGRARGRGTVWQFTSIDTSTDATAPILTPISPTPGETIYPSTPLVVQVEDNIGFSLREIWARFGTTNRWELVYGDDAFVAPHTGSSIETELGTPGPGYYDRRTYTVRRTGGWPSNASVVRLRFTVVDSAGNTLVLA
jgi:hypothetical protein